VIFFPFLAEAVFHLKLGDLDVNDERDNKEQNAGRQDDGTLEKHKGKQTIRRKPVIQSKIRPQRALPNRAIGSSH
jgi:hypothetical protein